MWVPCMRVRACKPAPACAQPAVCAVSPLRAHPDQRHPAGDLPVFLQGGTYGGSVLGCAAAAATLDVIKEENLLQNATQRGQQMTEGLLKLSQVGGVVL